MATWLVQTTSLPQQSSNPSTPQDLIKHHVFIAEMTALQQLNDQADRQLDTQLAKAIVERHKIVRELIRPEGSDIRDLLREWKDEFAEQLEENLTKFRSELGVIQDQQDQETHKIKKLLEELTEKVEGVTEKLEELDEYTVKSFDHVFAELEIVSPTSALGQEKEREGIKGNRDAFFPKQTTDYWWATSSDHIRRKPILPPGPTGLAINMISLSLQTFGRHGCWTMCCRSHEIESKLARPSTDPESPMSNLIRPASPGHRGIFIDPPLAVFVHCPVGIILGPLIGGYLAKAASQYPEISGNIQFLVDYPCF
ncbi:hypothetical protein PTTG_28053 [Puccinia triticina 1-1 BBBD Race 1]|uniref:Uncharacterized protein n=2 Tax=Puccinia triticina TaxID=208348 RepID=A0A180GET9_PUCT1|nr:hypothetical protein PTTG_28053 [Puccinia triticina 1-1 BBBD Race 1]